MLIVWTLTTTVVVVVLLWVSVTDVGDLNLAARAVSAGATACLNEDDPWLA